MDSKQQLVLQFIRQQLLGVVTTYDTERQQPQAAIVGISETPVLELVFSTANTTRKYKNLQTNPRVAIVIGGSIEQRISVQYEGVAQEIPTEAVEHYRAAHIQKNPAAAKFATDTTQRFFKVTPTWLRYSNMMVRPPEIFELTF